MLMQSTREWQELNGWSVLRREIVTKSNDLLLYQCQKRMQFTHVQNQINTCYPVAVIVVVVWLHAASKVV